MPIYHVKYQRKGYILGDRCNLNALVHCGSENGVIARIKTTDMTIVSITPTDLSPDTVYYLEENELNQIPQSVIDRKDDLMRMVEDI